jgi:hypothetical protein
LHSQLQILPTSGIHDPGVIQGEFMTMLAQIRLLVCLAFACLPAIASAQQAPLAMTPKTVNAGTTPALTLTTNGFFDLSQVTPSQISVTPSSGISGLRVSNASPQSMILSFDLSSAATVGQRVLSIEANEVTVSIKFMVERALCNPSNCRAPSTCVNGVCTPPPPPACSPSNCRPPRRCEDGVCVRPVVCIPRCRAPTPFCDNGVCRRLPPR